MKLRWYRGWPPRLILSVSLFIAVVTLFSILAVVWTLQTVYHDERPLFRADLKVEEITRLKLVYLANSQDLERLGLYAIMNTSDYDEVILELYGIDYRVKIRSPRTLSIPGVSMSRPRPVQRGCCANAGISLLANRQIHRSSSNTGGLECF